MAKRPTLIMLGSAGSGKGTQSELLQEQFGYLVIEAGEIFRQKAREDSPIGHRVKKINDSGGHAPDDLITQLMDEYLAQVPSEESLLIDGYPRTLGQADLLEGLLKNTGHETEKIIAIWINVPRAEAERRLLNRSQCTVCKTVFMNRDIKVCPHCNGEVKPRVYDKPESIKRRLDFFEQKTIPVIGRYRQEGVLIEVDGMQEVAHVFESIKKQLEPQLLNGDDGERESMA